MADDTEADADLLYGVPAIAKFLGIRDKQARPKIDRGLIPSFRIGGTICSRRATLKAWLAEQEAAARQDRS